MDVKKVNKEAPLNISYSYTLDYDLQKVSTK